MVTFFALFLFLLPIMAVAYVHHNQTEIWFWELADFWTLKRKLILYTAAFYSVLIVAAGGHDLVGEQASQRDYGRAFFFIYLMPGYGIACIIFPKTAIGNISSLMNNITEEIANLIGWSFIILPLSYLLFQHG